MTGKSTANFHRAVMRTAAGLLVGAAVLAPLACGAPERTRGAAPQPAAVVPRLFDLAARYRDMGLLTGAPPIPFVGDVRFLAGPSPESTLAMVGVSLANTALSFRRAGGVFEARYRVDVVFTHDRATVARFSSDETVRVASFQETARSDESVIFQRFALVPPVLLSVAITVRDLNTGGVSRAPGSVVAPRFAEPDALAAVVAVYRANGRARRDALPDLVMNPRATVPYGTDTLALYLESYQVQDELLHLRAVVAGSAVELWRDSVTLSAGGGGVAHAVVRLPPAALPVGELVIETWRAAAPADTVRLQALVNFSDQWVVANFDELLSLLRFFGHDPRLVAIRDAAAGERAGLWRAFWQDTDPNPVTPEHEGLEEYFRRVQAANERFDEPGVPGWTTERGEVFITLGEPDEVVDASSELESRRRMIRWTYVAHRLTLDFVDETGFGRFRLTPASRQAYHTVLGRVRRGS